MIVIRRRGVGTSGLNGCRRWRGLAGLLVAVGLGVHGATPPGVSYFSVDPAALEVVAGQAIEVRIVARDAAGAPVADARAPLTLRATVGGDTPPILISEWVQGAEPSLELANVSAAPVDLAGWSLFTYTQTSPPWPRSGFLIPAPAVCPPGGVVILRSRGPAPGKFPELRGGVSGLSLLPAPGQRCAMVLLDPQNRVADTLATGTPGLVEAIRFPTRIPESFGYGETLPSPPLDGQTSLQRVGHRFHGGAVDWKQLPASLGQWNPGLAVPFLGEDREVALTPKSFELIDGQWTGTLRVFAAATNLGLRVDDSFGRVGVSAPLLVVPGPGLALKAPARGKEGDTTTAIAAVSIPSPLTTNVVVRLESSDPQEIEVAASVVILAGTTAAEVPLRFLEDDALDGTQEVTLVARAGGFTEASAVIASEDNESAVLGLDLPSVMTKGETRFAFEGTVSVSAPVTKRVGITLSSNHPDLVRVPGVVELLPGDVSASFSIVAGEDYLLSGNIAVQLTASVPNWVAANGTLELRDVVRRDLLLRAPTEVDEAVGRTNLATLQIQGRLGTNLVIHLVVDPPGAMRLAGEWFLPAGESELVLAGEVMDDLQTNGTQTVTLRAIANGFESAVAEIRVKDNEFHHLSVDWPDHAVSRGESVPVEISARNVSGERIGGVNGPFVLEAVREEGSPVSDVLLPKLAGELVNGAWHGSVLPSGELAAARLQVALTNGISAWSAPLDIADSQSLPFGVTHVISDESRHRLLASVAIENATLSRGIAAIDPETGHASNLVQWTELPGALALSTDGQFLFAAEAEGAKIHRIRLQDNVEDQQWDLDALLGGPPTVPYLPPFVARGLRPVMGEPRSVLVAFGSRLLGTIVGVAAFDDGQLRPGVAIANGFLPEVVNEPGFDVRRTDYLLNWRSLAQLRIAPDGVSVERTLSVLPESDAAPTQATLADGVAYLSDGQVLDLAHGQARGRMAISGPVIREVANGRLYYLRTRPEDRRLEIVAIDPSSQAVVARLNVPGGSTDLPFNFVRWGEAGLAFLTRSGEVRLIRSPHLIPARDNADLGLLVQMPPGPLRVGDPVVYTLAVTNRGPASVAEVQIEDHLPPDCEVLEASVGAGKWWETNGLIHFQLGAVEAGRQAEVRVVLRARTPQETLHRVEVLGGKLRTEDDRVEVPFLAQFGATPPVITRFWVEGSALAYERQRDRLYVSGLEPGTQASRLLVLDLATGSFTSPIPVPDLMRKLTATADGQFLYGAVSPGDRRPDDTYFGTRIDRLRLPEGTLDRQFPVVDEQGLEHQVVDLMTVPGRPLDLVVARYWPQNDVALYANGEPAARSLVGLNIRYLLGDPEHPNEFVAYSRDAPVRLRRLLIEPPLLRVTTEAVGVLNAFSTGLWGARGSLYDSFGAVADLRTLSGKGTVSGGALAALDAEEDLLVYLRSEAGHWALRAFRASTAEPLWVYEGLEPFAQAKAFLACRRGTLALLSDDGRLWLIEGRRLPGRSVADLALSTTQSSVDTSSGAFSQLDLRLDVTNRGPDRAVGVVITNGLPAGSSLLAASVPFDPLPGGFENHAEAVLLKFGDLAAGESRPLSLRLRMPGAGTMTNDAVAGSAAQDPGEADNASRTVVALPQFLGDGWWLDGLNARDLAYDATRKILYASAPGTSAQEDRVLRLDPVSRRVVGAFPTGSSPTQLALSNGDRYLYVSVEGDHGIERIDLTSGEIDLRWSLGALFVAESLVVSPVDPDLVAVSLTRGRFGGSPRHAGAILYRNGVPLPEQSRSPIFANTVAFSADGRWLYAYDNETSLFGLHRFRVETGGLAWVDTIRGLIDEYDHRILLADDLIFASSGVVVDPRKGIRLGPFDMELPEYPAFTHLITVDSRSGSTFFVSGQGEFRRISQFRTEDRSLITKFPLPAVEGLATAIVPYGDRGLAVALAGGVFFTEIPLRNPSDLNLQLHGSTNFVRINEGLILTATVTNRGPGRAVGAEVQIMLSPTTYFSAGGEVTQGRLRSVGLNVMYWNPGPLLPGAGATARFYLPAAYPGMLSALAELRADAGELDTRDNSATFYGTAGDLNGTPFFLPAADARYLPGPNQILAALDAPHHVLLPLDPQRLVFGPPIKLPSAGECLGLTPDGQRLYVGLRDGTVANLDTPSLPASVAQGFVVGTNATGQRLTAMQLCVLPGNPSSVAVAGRPVTGAGSPELLIFDEGVPRASRAALEEGTTVLALALSADGRVLHVGTDRGYRRHGVTERGVSPLPERPVDASLSGRFEVAKGRIYFAAGPVLTEANGERVGMMPLVGASTVQPATDQLFVSAGPLGLEVMKVYDATNLEEQREATMASVAAPSMQLLLAGTNLVFARFMNQQALVVAAADPPVFPRSSDLRLTVAAPRFSVTIGQTTDYVLSIENSGPWSTDGVRLVHPRPEGLEWLSAEPTQGTARVNPESLEWEVGPLSSGHSATVTLRFRPVRAGRFAAEASITSRLPDPDPSNDAIAFTLLHVPVPWVDLPDFTFGISDAFSRSVPIPVTLSARASLPASAGLGWVDGSALAGIDYAVSRPLVTFGAGASESAATVRFLAQPEARPERTFTLFLTNLVNLRAGRTQAVVRLVDQRMPTVTVTGGSSPEGDSVGSEALRFQATLSSASSEPVSVGYRTVDGRARAGLDYRAASGTLVLPPGTTRTELFIALLGNRAWQGDREFYLVLGDVANARLGSAEAIGVILEDEDQESAPPEVQWIRIEAGGLRLGYRVPAGQRAVIEAAAELVPEAWTVVSEARASDGRTLEFVDAEIASGATRFYRVRVVP